MTGTATRGARSFVPVPWLLFVICSLVACWPRPSAPPRTFAPAGLERVRSSTGRPPVVLVARDGDPAVAIAAAVTTAGIGFTSSAGDDPEPATALAGLLEARLESRGIYTHATPSWDGVRVSVVLVDAAEALRLVDSLTEAFIAPASAADLDAARRKLSALGRRPLRDRALRRWARCVGTPYAPVERAGKDYSEVDLAQLERWRAGSFGLGRTAFSVTARAPEAERIARKLLDGPAWKAGAPFTSSSLPDGVAVDAFPSPAPGSMPTLYATLEFEASSAAVRAADTLGDPRGPLAIRLAELDVSFRVTDVTATAHPDGGCVGVVLEATSDVTAKLRTGSDLSRHFANAFALVDLEARAFEPSPSVPDTDARTLASLKRSGDAREMAERAAWWSLADQALPKSKGSSVALALPSRREGKDVSSDAVLKGLAPAIAQARTEWQVPVVEARTRIENGQDEAWVLIASPCGTLSESESDAGVTALFAHAAAGTVRISGDVHIEPWVSSDGAGVLVHGPALSHESPASHTRRLTDVAARAFAAEPIPSWTLAHARTDLFRLNQRSGGEALAMLAGALAPRHPSWVLPWGIGDATTRPSDPAVLLRAQALRTGPVRLAVLANGDASQADAAVRAADRWMPRRGAAARSCAAPTAAEPPRPGTYAVAARKGSLPEAYLAFPLDARNATARGAASLLAAALEGDGALAKALTIHEAAPLAREASARVLGWPHAPALVVRIVADEAKLDAAVMQSRALLDRIRASALSSAEFERARQALLRSRLETLLDPRARVVATWRGEPSAAAEPLKVTADDVARFAATHLREESMVVVAVRPPRSTLAP